MKTFMSAALLASMLLFGAMGASQVIAQANVLPAVDANRKMAPLSPHQLDPAEQKIFRSLPPGSNEARQFLYTRGYLRYSRLVVAGTLPASALPNLPLQENWNRRFLTEKEAKEVVDVALGMNLMHRMPPPVAAPREMAPLTPQQLDPAEQKTFRSLPPGSNEARQFLYTRGFLRYSRLVVDGKLAPSALPNLPLKENWNRGFLTEKEAKEVVDVALGMNLIQRMSR